MLLLVATTTLLFAAAPLAPEPTFRPISTEALDGTPIRVPHAGRTVVVVFSFDRSQSDASESWRAPLGKLGRHEGSPQLLFAPVAGEDTPGFVRGLIAAAIRFQIDDAAEANTAPLFIDGAALAKSLAVDTGRVAVVAIAPSGAAEVLATGEYNQRKRTTLITKLREKGGK